MSDGLAEIFFQSFLRETIVGSSSVAEDVPSLMLSGHIFFRQPRRRPPCKVARDKPEPRECLSFHSYQRRFQRAHKEVDLAPHPVVGLVFQIRDVEKFLQTPGLQKPGFFFSKQGPSLAVTEELVS